MLQAIRTVLSQYATFSGRASRPEFWWWALAILVLLAFTQIIDTTIIGPMLGFSAANPNSGQPLSVLVSLLLIVPNLAVSVRRLHDIDRPGWWVFIGLIPIIGTLVLLYFFVQPSDAAENRFGAAQPLPS